MTTFFLVEVVLWLDSHYGLWLSSYPACQCFRAKKSFACWKESSMLLVNMAVSYAIYIKQIYTSKLRLSACLSVFVNWARSTQWPTLVSWPVFRGMPLAEWITEPLFLWFLSKHISALHPFRLEDLNVHCTFMWLWIWSWETLQDSS